MKKALALAATMCLVLSACVIFATPISKQLGANPDGTFDTANPCILADGTDCKAPAGSALAWTSGCLDTPMAALTNVQVGTPTDVAIDACLTGTNAAAATITFVDSVSGATCNAQFSVTGASPNRLLHDAASSAISGSCKLKATSGSSVLSASYLYANVNPPSTDTSAPTVPTGIVCTPGNLSATCTFDAVMDQDTGIARTGVATYKIYSDTVWTDTLNAASPGLNCSFTAQTIGAAVSGSPSATQGSGFTGNAWTINARGYGLETGGDSYYGISCPVSGSAVYAISTISSIPSTLTYNKAIAGDIRNSTSTTSAHYACVPMRQVIGGATTYHIQRTMRTADGASNQTSDIQLPSSVVPPIYARAQVVSNVGECDYSTDGGAWTLAIGNDSITLNDSKIVVFGAAATTTGADDAAFTVPYSSVAVQVAGRLSKTVTLAAGTHTLKVSATDVTGNESAQNAGATITVASSGAGVHKWNPGYYARAHTHNLSCGVGCDSARHNLYSQIFVPSDSKIIGTEVWIDWKYLESDAGGTFTDGINWLTNELSYVNTTYPGKKVGVLLNFSPYGPSSVSQCSDWFPQYLCNAGCVYIEGSAAASGGSDSLNWFKTDPTCRGYFNRLIAAYGAAFDSNTTLEFVRIQQETDDAVNCCGFTGTAEDSAWKAIAASAVAAFPTTQIWIPMNWTGVGTAQSVEALIAYYKSIGAAIGDGDTIPEPIGTYPFGYTCPSVALSCVFRGLTASIGGSGHDYCGEMVYMGSVELSEMGYGSIGGHPGLSAQNVADIANTQRCAQYYDWEPNFNEVQDDGMGGATQYWNGATGQKWAIDTIPLTHTAKPAGYN